MRIENEMKMLRGMMNLESQERQGFRDTPDDKGERKGD
jgi:hypothetical protein